MSRGKVALTGSEDRAGIVVARFTKFNFKSVQEITGFKIVVLILLYVEY